MEVATAAPVDVRHPGATNSYDLTRLRTGTNVDFPLLAEDGRHRHLGSEHRLERRDWKLQMKIGAVTLEKLMLLDRRDHKEVACRTSKGAALAFTGEPKPHSRVHTSRYRNLQHRLFFGEPGPPALVTGVTNDLPSAATRRAGLSDRQETAPESYLA